LSAIRDCFVCWSVSGGSLCCTLLRSLWNTVVFCPRMDGAVGLGKLVGTKAGMRRCCSRRRGRVSKCGFSSPPWHLSSRWVVGVPGTVPSIFAGWPRWGASRRVAEPGLGFRQKQAAAERRKLTTPLWPRVVRETHVLHRCGRQWAACILLRAEPAAWADADAAWRNADADADADAADLAGLERGRGSHFAYEQSYSRQPRHVTIPSPNTCLSRQNCFSSSWLHARDLRGEVAGV
jgi:hypothetical protein